MSMTCLVSCSLDRERLKGNTLATCPVSEKCKVWQFLQWLKHHNRLYTDLLFDESVMVLYPDDGYLPGIQARVIKDNQSDAEKVFKDETAGFSEHPAELIKPNPTAEDDPVVLIEKMGVSDPECDRIPVECLLLLRFVVWFLMLPTCPMA